MSNALPERRSTARWSRRQLVLGSAGLALGACARPSAGENAELWLAGDLHFGNGTPALFDLDPELANASGVINLEGPVADSPSKAPGKLRLHNAPGGLAGLRKLGVQVACIANNHSEDAGIAGVTRTAKALESAGLSVAGQDLVARIGSVGVTAHDLQGIDLARLRADLERAKAASAHLVATFHVTAPPSYLPTPTLRAAVQVALEAGASVVAAHGSHMIGPVERRGNAVIAWGLGNLQFACDCTEERDGLILRVSLGAGPIAARVIPIDAGLHGKPARPAHDPALIFQLLDALGSSKLEPQGRAVEF